MRIFGLRLGEPVTAKSLAVAGDAARDRRAWKAAARHYAASLELDPDRTDLWVQLGHACKESGDLAGAADAYRRAIAREPGNADTLLQLGHLFKLEQRWSEAAEAYMAALRLDFTLEDPARELAEMLEREAPLEDPHAVAAALVRRAQRQEVQEGAHKAPRDRLRPPVTAGRPKPPGRRPPSTTASRRRLLPPPPPPPVIPDMPWEPEPEPAVEPPLPPPPPPPPVEPPPPPAPEPQRYFPLAADVGLTRLLDGHFLYVDPMDETVASHLIARGYWEDWIHRTVCALVRPGDHIVEVGANFGVYTVAMARIAGPTGSVVTFEANPRLAELVQRSVRFNGYSPMTEVIAKAAADKPGEISFAVSRSNAGGGTISSQERALGADGELIHVETVTLDSVAPKDVRFIRMDAEGSEPLILRGARRLLKRPDIVVCMEWDVIQMAARADLDQHVSWLAGMGFRFWRIQYDASLLEIPADRMAALSACDVVMSRVTPDGPPIASEPL